MQQLILPLFFAPPASFANYRPGPNREAWQTLQKLSNTITSSLPPPNIGHTPQHLGETILYCFGPSGAGKTHLLQASTHSIPRSVYLDGQLPIPEDPPVAELEKAPLLALDHADQWNSSWQSIAFSLINHRKNQGLATVVGGRLASLQLPLRDDLRTRIGSGLALPLALLGENECQQAITQHLSERQIQVAPEVISYLFKRFPRDLNFLMQLLEQLDQWSLQQKRPITLPLLQEYWQHLQSQRQNNLVPISL